MLLILHLAGAAMTIALVGISVWKLRVRSGGYELPVILLPGLAVYQIITGVLLVAAGGSLTRVCVSGSVYLAGVGMTEYGLIKALAAQKG